MVGRKSLVNWLKQIDDAVKNGNARSAIRKKHKGRTGTGYADHITAAHLTNLHIGGLRKTKERKKELRRDL